MEKAFFAGIYTAAAIVLAVYLYRAVLKKDILGRSMTKVLFFGLVAVLSYTIYLCTNDYFVMSMCNSLVFVCIDWDLFFLVQFCLLFTSNKDAIRGSYRYGAILLILDSLHLLLNPFFEQTIGYEVVSRGRDLYLVFRPHLLFQIHLGICYVMVAAIVFIMLEKCVKVAKLYRVRYSVFVAAFFAVILINVVFLMAGGIIDYSIITYAVLGCFLYFYVYDYNGEAAANATKAFFVEEMNNPIVLFDYEGKMLMSNRRARELFGVEEGDGLSDFLSQNPYLQLNGEDEQTFETTYVFKDMVYYFQIQYKYLKDSKERAIGSVFVYNDITEKKRALIRMEYNATHDILTGTYNRNYISSFKKEMEEKQPYPIWCGVYNINGMRDINREYGTQVGDKVLRRMAWLLQQMSRVTDYVIRIDGGEMLLILPGTTEKKANDIFKKIERRVSCFDVDGIVLTADYSYFYLENIEEFDKIYEEAHCQIAIKKKRTAEEKVTALKM